MHIPNDKTTRTHVNSEMAMCIAKIQLGWIGMLINILKKYYKLLADWKRQYNLMAMVFWKPQLHRVI